jgi:hypothetical protein
MMTAISGKNKKQQKISFFLLVKIQNGWARGVAQVGKYLPCKHKGQSSNPTTTKKEKKKNLQNGIDTLEDNLPCYYKLNIFLIYNPAIVSLAITQIISIQNKHMNVYR